MANMTPKQEKYFKYLASFATKSPFIDGETYVHHYLDDEDQAKFQQLVHAHQTTSITPLKQLVDLIMERREEQLLEDEVENTYYDP